MDLSASIEHVMNSLGIYEPLNTTLTQFGLGSVMPLIIYTLAAVGLFVFAAVTVLAITYMERKVLADLQVRLGPMVAGPHGILQPIADATKLLFKEDILPINRDKLLYFIAPIIVFVPTYLLLTIMPFDENIILANVGVSLLLFIALSSLTPLGMFLAGYGSGNKYSTISAIRSAAQMMSYEIPIVLVALSVVVLAGSMNIVDIVKAQQNSVWFFLVLPIGFFIILVASIAEMGRTPFDTIEAESELIAGYNIEYSGMRFAFFYLAEYLHLFIGCALITLLFLGGWEGILIPNIPGVLWFLGKTFVLVYLAIWIRGTLPRVRIDQLLNLSWKYLLPLALLNLGLSGVIAFML